MGIMKAAAGNATGDLFNVAKGAGLILGGGTLAYAAASNAILAANEALGDPLGTRDIGDKGRAAIEASRRATRVRALD